MKKALLISFAALMLNACANISIEDAKITNAPPPGDRGKQPILKTLNKETRDAIFAENPDALIIVVTDKDTYLLGAPGKGFKYEPSNPKAKKSKKSQTKEPVISFTIETYVNSPACQSYKDLAGNIVWYPSDCPH